MNSGMYGNNGMYGGGSAMGMGYGQHQGPPGEEADRIQYACLVETLYRVHDCMRGQTTAIVAKTSAHSSQLSVANSPCLI